MTMQHQLLICFLSQSVLDGMVHPFHCCRSIYCKKNVCFLKIQSWVLAWWRGTGVSSYQSVNRSTTWKSVCRVGIHNTSLIHNIDYPVVQHTIKNLPISTTCLKVSWALEDVFHPVQLLDIRGLHNPQSMAKTSLILRSLDMTLGREL